VFRKPAGMFVRPDMPEHTDRNISAAGAPVKSGIGFVVKETIAFAL
jgi:hypothetical protein